VYDIQAQVELMGTRECVDVGPIVKLQGHNGEVEAVSWHGTHHDILASAGADRIVNIWDIRSNVPQESETLHRAAVKDVKFHPTAAFLLATCSADRAVRVWDLRKLRRPLCELVGHFDTVNGLEWAPFNDLLLLSYSRDRTVICWDVSKTMQPRLPVEDDQAKPELVFQHFGHTANVRQATWCPHEEDEWSIASVDDNNVLQVWAPHERVYNDEADQEVYGTEGV
jgi:histone-binding protein RBBP4